MEEEVGNVYTVLVLDAPRVTPFGPYKLQVVDKELGIVITCRQLFTSFSSSDGSETESPITRVQLQLPSSSIDRFLWETSSVAYRVPRCSKDVIRALRRGMFHVLYCM